jgi:hypothetical protein
LPDSKATQAEAEAGTDNSKWMTPLRVKQEVVVLTQSLVGLKGDKGDKGDTGNQGLKGDKGDKGDPGTGGGTSYNQSLNTTDSPTFVSVHTSDGTLSGGIWPGFDADKTGIYFEDTHAGSMYIHSSLTSGVDYHQTLQAANGTIALTSNLPNQNLNTNSIVAFRSATIGNDISLKGDTNHCILSSTDPYTQSKIGGIYTKGTYELTPNDWTGLSTIENNGDGWRIKFNDEGENEADTTGSPSNAVYPASPWLFIWPTGIQVQPCDAQGNVVTPETANISISSSFEANQSHLTASGAYGTGDSGDPYGWEINSSGSSFNNNGGDFRTSYNIGSITNIIDDGTPAVCQLPATSGKLLHSDSNTLSVKTDANSIELYTDDTQMAYFGKGTFTDNTGIEFVDSANECSIFVHSPNFIDENNSHQNDTHYNVTLPSGNGTLALTQDIPAAVASAITNADLPAQVTSVVNTQISGAIESYLSGSSYQTVYASSVATLNSNIDTGGGTNVTAQLQAVLDSVQSGGHLELVVDGVALISTLRVWKNTTIRCLPGCGFFQAPGTNWHLLTTGYVLPTEPSHDNISLIGGIYNCNGNNQSKWENDHNPEEDPWGWVFGLWIGWFKNFTMRDVLVRNAKTFAVTMMQGDGVDIQNCATLWDDGVDVDDFKNRDSLHFWGPVSNVKVKGFVSNGDDDVIALNTDENTNPDAWPTAQPRRGSGGVLRNLVFEDIVFSDSARGIRFYKDGINPLDQVVSNVVFKNITGNILSFEMSDGNIKKDYVEINGWNVSGAKKINITHAKRVRLVNIATGTPKQISTEFLSETAGSGYQTNLGWNHT